jgi:hypothetical protein
MKTIVSYGAGTNSTAMLIGCRERGVPIDAITFADTGGEKPHTYDHIRVMNDWLESNGMPQITIVRGSQPAQVRRGSLEAECLELGTMPSKVYGYGNCSQKWKIDPQNKFDKVFAAEHGITVDQIIRLIGFDADEPSRSERAIVLAEKRKHLCLPQQQFPLVEWGWGRDECIDAIKRAGLPLPGKSACFFCPSSKKVEILWLRDHHPDLLVRAIEMERRALAGEGQAPASQCDGLGRHFSWREVAYGTCAVSDNGIPEIDCGCYDGDDELPDWLK